MTITYTGGNSTSSSSTNSIGLTHGLTINEGDLVVAYVNRNGTNTITPSQTWDGSEQHDIAGETARAGLFWLIAGASEPATYTFTFTGSDRVHVILKVFAADDPIVIDAAINTDDTADGTTTAINCEAVRNQTVSDNSVSIVAGGSDGSYGTSAYTSADNSYVSVIGNKAVQDSAMAHRIFTTGQTFGATDVIILTAGSPKSADNNYSHHVSFVENAGGGSTVPTIVTNLSDPQSGGMTL